MAEANTPDQKKMTWPNFLKWTAFLYLASLGGVFIKIYFQEGGKFVFTNSFQVIAVSLIPLVFMILVSPILLAGLALKRFKIQNSKNTLYIAAIIYTAVFISRLISTQPL